ncbi:calcium/hydrogen antiporter ASCRUDRAFT_40283 [Ascoidea rubescens DSM 1968]|uniref:Calcium permease n=1 Tax=Ascoidea rubescens DSM 1968 TaxID=1344418 RepID=A0A1D2V890_9ASCO|nr:hypothetical protein ASCRUDRAFT_40283 [Ascoidea rubescens DSM 1968]ODV57848.1 hypothetical protein ASCRUDRAFT_40283 [Ascoidea rubescens DSM 1968]
MDTHRLKRSNTLNTTYTSSGRNAIANANPNQNAASLQNFDLNGSDLQNESDYPPFLNLNTNNDNQENSADSESISSLESFTLRERQDAINTTHPFGIRIWKPALYKKIRSVQRQADSDIHQVNKNIGRKITFWVSIGNIIWFLTFGLILFITCLIGFFFTLLINLFFLNLKKSSKNNSLNYTFFIWKLGLYFLNPFGKVIYLYKDSNYIDEDINEGITIREYQRWRNNTDQRGLFFSSRGMRNSSMGQTNVLNSNTNSLAVGPGNEITPLLSHQPSINGSVMGDGDGNYHSLSNDPPFNPEADEHDYIDLENGAANKVRFFGRGKWNVGRLAFYIYYYIFLAPVLYIISFLCWLLVFSIPMSKVTTLLLNHLRKHPLAIFFKDDKNSSAKNINNSNILLCTYRFMGFHYYKYTVDGTNVFLINLMFGVIFVIFDFYFLSEYLELELFLTHPSVIFGLCLASVIPLAYFIGQAVASISAQSSMGAGAVINAFFSTVVEVFLYCVALNQSKGKLVEGSLIGSILGAVLLLPGLSMCAGAVKRKTQRYNPKSAGVSSTMLLFSMVVMFAPSIFQQIFGAYEITCTQCNSGEAITSNDCRKCHFSMPSLKYDILYSQFLKPLTIFASIILFLAYCIGLWFTLRTHAALIWQTNVEREKEGGKSMANSTTLNSAGPEMGHSPNLLPLDETSGISSSIRRPSITRKISSAIQNIAHTVKHEIEGPSKEEEEAAAGGHDAPNWSRSKSSIILLGATVLYAIIAEILVDCVDVVLQEFPINPKFLGLTVFALVPNTTEFLNAISFAMHGNVALSMEIGSAYVLQVILLQIPALVIYSVYNLMKIPSEEIVGVNLENNYFTLLFPRWDLVISMISVYMFTYIYAEGKSNYFKGSLLILMYLVVIFGFYFSDIVQDATSYTFHVFN